MERREKERGELGFQNHILDIPIHILCEIMFKLPAVSIVRCGSVCTKFRTIVTDSAFQQAYFSRAPVSCVALSDHHRLSCIDCCAQTETLASNHGSSCMAMQAPSSKRRNSSPIDPINRHGQQLRLHSNSHLRSINRRRRRSRFVTFHTHRSMNLVNSSHGLLCLRASNYRSRTYAHPHSLYYICNPLLGEILSVLPAPTDAADESVCFSAFGFDPKAKHYKILQLVLKSDSNQMVAELYRLGDKAWSVIEIPFYAKPKANSSFDPSINGALHWVTDSSSSSSSSSVVSDALICSFDLHRNELKWVAPPSHFDAEYVNKISGVSVGVLKGCLCLCYVIGGALFETWSMDKYGVKESWKKVFSIDIKSYCGLRPQDKHRPIGFNSSGDMWLRADSDTHSHSQCLVSFSAERGVFRHIDFGGVASYIEATPQVLSYVSLKDMVNLGGGTQLQLQTLRTPKSYYAFGFNIMFPMANFR